MSNPTEPTDVGRNRTGIATSPIDVKKSIEGARAGTPLPQPDGQELAIARLALSREVEPVGTMPPPGTLKRVAKTAMQALKGNNPNVFLDLLGERLAFERTGTRLYDALLVKFDAAHEHPGGPTREDLERIRDEELQHFVMLKEALETLGADPTAITPSADITAVASMGLVQVLGDPRTTLTEALKTIQIAELADNDGWLMLADVAGRLGHDQLAERFRQALAEEEEHLARVRSWVAAAIDGQAGLESRGGAQAGATAASLGNSDARRP